MSVSLIVSAVLFAFITIVVSDIKTDLDAMAEYDYRKWAKAFVANLTTEQVPYETSYAYDNLEDETYVTEIYIPSSDTKSYSSGSSWRGHAHYTVVIIIPGSGIVYCFVKKRRVTRVDLVTVTVEQESAEPTLQTSEKESLYPRLDHMT